MASNFSRYTTTFVDPITSFSDAPNLDRAAGYSTVWEVYTKHTAKCNECSQKIKTHAVQCKNCMHKICDNCFDNGGLSEPKGMCGGVWKNLEGCWCAFASGSGYPSDFRQRLPEMKRLAKELRNFRALQCQAQDAVNSATDTAQPSDVQEGSVHSPAYEGDTAGLRQKGKKRARSDDSDLSPSDDRQNKHAKVKGKSPEDVESNDLTDTGGTSVESTAMTLEVPDPQSPASIGVEYATKTEDSQSE